MRVFQVRQGGTAAILWTGEAKGEPEALDAMAHAAGYRDAGTLPEGIRGRGLSVEELRFGVMPQAAGTLGRSAGGRSGRVFRTGVNGQRDERNFG